VGGGFGGNGSEWVINNSGVSRRKALAESSGAAHVELQVIMVRSMEVTGIGWGSVLEDPRQDGKILENGINKKNLSKLFASCQCHGDAV
jgi:hypothetical protein